MNRKLLVLDTSYGYEAIEARQLHDSVTCRDLGGFFEHVWTVHPFGALVSEGATAKFGAPEVHTLSAAHTFIDGKLGPTARLGALPMVNFLAGQTGLFAQLSALIRREKISAIRAGDPLYTGLLGLFLANRHGIPLAIRVNANYDRIHADTGRPMMPRFFRSYRVEKRVMRFVLSRTDLVAAVNPDNRQFAIDNGARPEFSTVFRYGNLIDRRHLARPETRDKSWTNLREFWSEPVRFLLHIGRLEVVKLADDVIRVLAEVRRRGHEVKALMVGDGTQRADLIQLARELGVEQHVVFCGNRGQDWLAQVVPLAAVVVSPLTGRALTEAAFGGAPIVAYDLDWQGELIHSGKTGELVPPRELDKLADGVERFLNDSNYARAMGSAVREAAFDMLDPERLDQHERDSYSELFRRFASRRIR